MDAFEKKALETPRRVCVRLKELREAKKITLIEVARRTRISQKYLEAIESCQFDRIPFGTIYQKNFIKRYAEALGIAPGPYVEQFYAEEILPKETPAPLSIQAEERERFSNLPQLLRSLVLSAVTLLLIGYLGVQVKKSIEPPALSISSPPDGFVATNETLLVQGSTEHEAQVSINGQDIVTDGNGQFTEQLYLSSGVNTIVVTAKKKHGKATTETRHVILREPTNVSLNTNQTK